MADATLQKILEMAQGDAPTALRLAELTGARIGVRSQAGRGSVFWVRLPIEANQTAPAAISPGS